MPRKVMNGTHLIIVVEESLNILPIGDIDLHYNKYGNKEFWVSVTLDVNFNNFRGKRETLWLHGELWERKAFGIGWSQPIRSYKSFHSWWRFKITDSPHDFYRINISTLSTEVGMGKWIIRKIRVFARANFFSMRIDSLSSDSDQNIRFPILGTGLVWDTRNRSYPAHMGQIFSFGIDRFGGPDQNNINFMQASFGYRKYEPIFGSKHTAVFALNLVKRLRKPPYFYQMFGGSENSIRGYGAGSFRGENKVTGALEYRFPIWKTPTISVPFADTFVPAMGRLNYIIDGAFFVDAGTFWDNGSDPEIPSFGYGFGTRIWVPPLRRSAVADLAWDQFGNFLYHLYLDIVF